MKATHLLQDMDSVYVDDTCGRSSPLGATPICNGVNFSVYSRHATRVDLLLFDSEEDSRFECTGWILWQKDIAQAMSEDNFDNLGD